MGLRVALLFAASLVDPAAVQDAPSSPIVDIPPPGDPVGTVTVETYLGDVEVGTPAGRKGGGRGPALIGQSSIFTSDNYPQIAWEEGISGVVKVVVTVDPNGVPTACKTVGTPPAELGGATCALFLGQARFVPAADRKGRAVSGEYTRTVRWELPQRPPLPVEAGISSMTIGFDAQGVNTSCIASRPEWAKDEDDDDPCLGGAMMAQLLAATNPRPDWAEWELHIEMHAIPGSDPYWKSIGAGRDVELVSRYAMQLTIDRRGLVRQCDVMESEANHPMMSVLPACPRTKRLRYIPASVDSRPLQLVNVVYFRRKDAGKPNA